MKSKPSLIRSRYEITLAASSKRLATADLPPKARRTLEGQLEHVREPDFALWIDAPLESIDRRELATDSARAAVIVFAAPVTLARPLVLRHDEIMGVRTARDAMVFVFLEPVRARDVCVVPGTLAVFARGLTVERLASFDAPDSHTAIGGHLDAPYVLANLSGGGVYLDKGCSVSVRAYARKIDGLPTGTKPTLHRSLRSMFPFLDEGADEDDVWSVALDLARRDGPFPTTDDGGNKSSRAR